MMEGDVLRCARLLMLMEKADLRFYLETSSLDL